MEEGSVSKNLSGWKSQSVFLSEILVFVASVVLLLPVTQENRLRAEEEEEEGGSTVLAVVFPRPAVAAAILSNFVLLLVAVSVGGNSVLTSLLPRNTSPVGGSLRAVEGPVADNDASSDTSRGDVLLLLLLSGVLGGCAVADDVFFLLLNGDDTGDESSLGKSVLINFPLDERLPRDEGLARRWLP